MLQRNTPLTAGLPPQQGVALKWKSKLISSSGTFDPGVEAPGIDKFYLKFGAGGGGGGDWNSAPGPAGGFGQMFELAQPITLAGPVTITIGAGGTRGIGGGTGGNTTIVGSVTAADGTKPNFTAFGASGKFTRIGPDGFVTVNTAGTHGVMNAAAVYYYLTGADTGAAPISTFYIVGGIICGAPGGSASAGIGGAGGYMGKGADGASSTGTAADHGYCSGGSGCGNAGGGQGTNGRPGFVEFGWWE